MRKYHLIFEWHLLHSKTFTAAELAAVAAGLKVLAEQARDLPPEQASQVSMNVGMLNWAISACEEPL